MKSDSETISGGVFIQRSKLSQTWQHTHICPFKGSEDEEDEEECPCCSGKGEQEKKTRKGGEKRSSC